ncbi:MAG: ABC transporter permease [Fimbriimonadaceae bacterium]|jgi:simple sugar transport system permease protein|nr:ABC transporter permease [Fimbriimonadaceae bacterium]
MKKTPIWGMWLFTVGAFAFVVAILVLVKAVPLETFSGMVTGALGTPGGWRGTLREMTPLLILGAAVFLALKAGLFNIGADGQYTVGALAGVATALAVPGPLGMVLALGAGCLAGALWALPAGLIKAYKGGHEVITTIMMNNIARFLTVALVAGPLRNPAQESATTKILAKESQLPILIQDGPFRLNIALFLGLGIVIGVGIWLRTTVSGYELMATGANKRAAEASGVSVAQTLVKAMTASGLLAGLAGAVHVLAYENRFYADFSPGFGFDALGVALLAASNPFLLIPAALLFGAISQGTSAISILGVPKGLSGVLLGLTILVFAVFRYRKETPHA